MLELINNTVFSFALNGKIVKEIEIMFKPGKELVAHPGEILQMILIENGITQTVLAHHLGVPQAKVSEICRGKRGVSAEMAMKLAKVLGVSANTWMNIQKNWELSQVDRNKLAKVKKLRRIFLESEKEAA